MLLPVQPYRFSCVWLWPSMRRRYPPELPYNLRNTRADNGRLLVELDLATVISSSLDGLDNSERLVVSDLAEDNVLAIEPTGDNGGDEELGAIPIGTPN